MKVGDKVICIENHNNGGWLSKNDSVTKGKVYEVTDTLVKDRIRVREKGNSYYPTNLFISVEQHRDNQINQILS